MEESSVEPPKLTNFNINSTGTLEERARSPDFYC